MKTVADLKGSRLIAKVKLHNYRFPRSRVESGNFAIVALDLIRIIEGELPDEFELKRSPGKYQFIATGHLPKLEEGSEYVFQGILIIDKEWGAQYETESMRLDFDLSRSDDQKKFFSYFMSEKQVDALFAHYESPIDLLETKNLGELQKIKGIGPATSARMCIRYEECKNNGRAYVALKSLDLSKRVIDRLIKFYGSADVVVEKIENNPYILIKEVRGIGWKKADDFAMRQGMARNSKERVLAYADYYLDQQAIINGNSWVTIEDLFINIVAECSPITNETISAWLKEYTCGLSDFDTYYARYCLHEKNADDPWFFYDKTCRHIGLLKYRMLEKAIADNMKRIKESPSNTTFDPKILDQCIQKAEKEQNFIYTEEQKTAMRSALQDNVTILTGGAGCVDGDTEFLTSEGWKKIRDYQSGDKVLMYNPDSTAEFVHPSDYVKYSAKFMWHVENAQTDMCLSDEHNVYYLDNNGRLVHNNFGWVHRKHAEESSGFDGKFITTFNPKTNRELNLSDAQIRLMAVLIQIGYFSQPGSSMCSVFLHNSREKAKLRDLLQKNQILFHESCSSVTRMSEFRCSAPMRSTVFERICYGCSSRQLKVFCEAILDWRGLKGCKSHYVIPSINSKFADFMQLAFASIGYRGVIVKGRDRKQKVSIDGVKMIYIRNDYRLNLYKKNLASWQSSIANHCRKAKISTYHTQDGYKYCFTVPTHMWIMRRNGKISVTGNTGKSSTLRPLVDVFQYYGLTVGQCALSGRASSLLNDITKVKGKTIHRLLNFLPEQDIFAYTDNHPLPYDVVVLDEASMVGGELFLSLISAIKTGAKFIMLGDTNQLESIGLANILKDSLSSGYIKTNTLTKIHRQAAMSGIIGQSLLVSEGKSIVANSFIGEEIRGELQDFKLVGCSESLTVQANIIKEFRRLYQTEKIPIDDIQVIVPTKTRGDNSCRILNAIIQQIVNPELTNKDTIVDYKENGITYQVRFKPKDRIIVTKNNYHAEGTNGSDQQIFNGNMGVIKDISEDVMVITVGDVGDIVLPQDQWDCIQLGYAITVHKKQGDSIPYAIVGIDSSSYALLSRELLYTAITRASKYCVLVAQPKAINIAVRTSRIKLKQTWLKDDLFNCVLADEGVSVNTKA